MRKMAGCSGKETIAFRLELPQLVQQFLRHLSVSCIPLIAGQTAYLDFIGLQGAPTRLLLQSRLEAFKHLVHEIAIVDAKELRELRGSAAARLERLLFGRGIDACGDAVLGR